MTIEVRSGDLFEQTDVHALGHGVNCRGVMGAGIAKQFANRYPEMVHAYRNRCHNGTLAIGGVYAHPLDMYDSTTLSWIYNMATQDALGRNATYWALDHAVDAMLDHMSAHRVQSVAIPKIGAGIGGLDWHQVHDRLNTKLTRTREHMVLVV